MMTVPSGIYELAQMEIQNARADLASRMETYVSKKWIMTELFGFTDAEVRAINRQRKKEAKEEEAMAGGFGGFGGGAPATPPEEAPPGEEPEETPPEEEPEFGGAERRKYRGRRLVERDMTRDELRKVNERLSEILLNDKKLYGRLLRLQTFMRDLRETAFVRNRNGRIRSALA